MVAGIYGAEYQRLVSCSVVSKEEGVTQSKSSGYLQSSHLEVLTELQVMQT